MDKHWALNYEPYRGKNHYVIWVSGEGEIAEIICKDKTVVDKMAASKDMYEALKNAVITMASMYRLQEYTETEVIHELIPFKTALAKAEAR